MEMERERLLAEGASADALLEPGNVDMIEVVCSLIDSVIEIVGDTIVVPEHGFVGSARRKLPAVTHGTANQGQSTGTGNGSDAKKTGDLADGDLSALLDAAKENLKTSEAAKIFDHLKSSIADLDQRCRNVQQTLTSLQGTIVTLEKKIKTMH
uniref:Uncharacterized protein n=1 Tax=Plectus sambesii TaxID=2011161 RepID=A0A914V306_9BILA